MDEMIPTAWQGEIDQVITRHGDGSVEAAIVKTVALLSNVRALKLDVHNLAVLIHPASDAESRRAAVAAGLEVLLRDEALREGEDGYRLQSPREKDWEKTRRSRELKTRDFNRLLREQHLPAMLRGLVAAAGSGFKRQFKVEVLYDDERVLEGEVPLRVYEGGDDQLQRAIQRSRESAHDNDVFLVFARGETSWRHAEEVFRSQEMIKDADARSLQEGETELLHEERKRYERHVRALERTLAGDLLKGSLIFRGNSEELAGGDVRPALATAMATHLAEIYTRLDEWTAPVARRDAIDLLRADDLAGAPDYLRDPGLRVVKVEADGHKIDEMGPVAQFVAAVKERVEYGSEPPGKYLETHFQRPPFGAELDVVMVVAAACVRAGLVLVAQGGSWLTSRTDARLEQVFAAVPKFRAAVFRTREEIDVNVRTRVAKLLHNDLVGERPGLATEDLALFARQRLEPDRQSMERVMATLSGLGLGVSDAISRARQILNRMRVEDDETLVGSLDAGRSDLKDGILAGRDLRQLVDDEDRVGVLRAAKASFETNGQDLSDTGRRALQLGREILETRSYPERFAELRGAVEAVRAERQMAWAQARTDLELVIADLRERAAPLLGQLNEARQAHFEERLGQANVPVEATFDNGPSYDSLAARAAQLPSLIDQLREEIGKNEGKNVRRVAARDLFTEPVRGEDDLKTLLRRIREAAENAFDAGDYFLLT
jgi:hypothetical protein